MAQNSGCVETARCEAYYIIDRKDPAMGPVDIIPAEDYDERVAKALQAEDPELVPAIMLNGPDVLQHFSPGELRAYGAYILAGMLTDLAEGSIVTAYENMRDLDKEKSS